MSGFYANGETENGGAVAASSSPPVSSTVTGVTVTPSSVTVAGGGTVDFDWVVLGTNSPSQAATPTTNLGTIGSTGILIAPAAISVQQNGTVTVTSVQDPTKSGTASFTVPAAGVIPTPSQYPIIALYSPMRATGINLYSKLL